MTTNRSGPGSNGTGQLFQTFFHGTFSAFETACLRSFIDHGHRVVVYAYDHATTPDFCERADARDVFPEASVFRYQTGFGAGSVSAFSNLFRYKLLLENGGWWIDTDVVCLAPAWPEDEIVAATEDDERVGSAVLRFPRGHQVMAQAAAECMAAGDAVKWGQTGPALITRLLHEHGLAPCPSTRTLFYPLHWSEWLDLIDPACADAIAQRTRGAVALHLWNEKFRHYGFQPALTPPKDSFLYRLAERHGGAGQFMPADQRALAQQINLARTNARNGMKTGKPFRRDPARPGNGAAAKAQSAMPRRCVYTALTGGYETLTEQPVALTSAIPFICFTDDPGMVSRTWQIRPLKMLLAGDFVRSQRDYKLRPYRVLPEFDNSLYIDNSVLLKVDPEEIFNAVDLSSGLSLPAHSYRETILDEFDRVSSERLDDPLRIAEQLEHYSANHPEILQQQPYWNAIMLRDHHNPVMISAMELWLAQILRYSRRDQLSGYFAFNAVGLVPEIMRIDNFESWFHSWPVNADRKMAQRVWQKADTAASTNVRIRALQAQRDELAQINEAMLASTTWRMMEPVRHVMKFIRDRKK